MPVELEQPTRTATERLIEDGILGGGRPLGATVEQGGLQERRRQPRALLFEMVGDGSFTSNGGRHC